MTSAAARLSPQTCFRLPHCLGCFAACGYTHPPGDAGYGDFVTSAKAALPWLADYRLPPVIVLPLWLLMLLGILVLWVFVLLLFPYYPCLSIYVLLVFGILVFLYYMGRSCVSVLLLLEILRLLMIPA